MTWEETPPPSAITNISSSSSEPAEDEVLVHLRTAIPHFAFLCPNTHTQMHACTRTHSHKPALENSPHPFPSERIKASDLPLQRHFNLMFALASSPNQPVGMNTPSPPHTPPHPLPTRPLNINLKCLFRVLLHCYSR